MVFCSKGDNITPPQQALDWILDLYDSVDDIRAYGQTIVYTVHDKSATSASSSPAGVARKEHDEFASNIDLIDVLPPGLYEAVLTPKGEAVDNPDLVTGEWVMRCEARTLDDIRALGGNDLEDERRFAAAARVSEINLALYRAFAAAGGARAGHAADGRGDAPDAPAAAPLRDVRPAQPVAGLGRDRGRARARAPAAAAADNPFVAVQEQVSQQIVDGARGLAQGGGAAGGGRFPRDLRHAGAAGRARHRHRLAAAARARRRRASCTRRWSSAGSPSSGPRMAAGGLPRRWSARCSTSAWRATPSTSAASRRSAACATPTRPAGR